ncbi:transposase [Limosilactobacillus reuteri]|uniref:Transposase n=1 Tax=Limosilactobacillus reuteri TaxID=1598 RepID=A0A517D5G5_LIMRT|nr:transposase [Limosilactobacillus reuteri]
MLYKRFENGHLSWQRNSNEAKELSAQQLDWLLQGLNPLPIHKIQAARPVSCLYLKEEFFDIITKEFFKGGDVR